MDVGKSVASLGTFDILALVFLFAMFVLGYIQGTIRRLLGLASIVFSFLFAAQLRDPVGGFLATNWTHLPREYDYMFGFLTVFVAASIAFSIVIQGFYKRTPLFERYSVVDELLGGLLGILQGLVILGAVIVILDTFYRVPGIAPDSDEISYLRDFFNAYNGSQTAEVFRTVLIPAFFALFGFLVPQAVRDFFPGA